MKKKEWVEFVESVRYNSIKLADHPFAKQVCDCTHRRDLHQSKASNIYWWGHDSISGEAECGDGECTKCRCRAFEDFYVEVERIRNESA